MGLLIVIGMIAAVLLMIGSIGNIAKPRPEPPTPAEMQKRLAGSEFDLAHLRRMEEQARKMGADPQIIQRLEQLRRKQGG